MRALRPIVPALAALALPGAGAPAQNVQPRSDVQAAHEAVVRAERAALFFERLAAAGVERRALALETLERLVSPGAPAGAPPPLRALSAAVHVLDGEDPELVADAPLQRFADAIDLQVVPGVFEPVTEGRGAPLVVRVYLLEALHTPAGSRIALDWIDAEGGRTRARELPLGPRAFAPPGFDLHVRSPLAAGGVHRLAPVALTDESEATGIAVDVPCVAGFAARLEAVGAAVSEDDAMHGSLVDLFDLGVRTEVAEGPEARLSLLEELAAGRVAPPPGRVLRLERDRESPLSRARCVYPAREPRAVVLLLTEPGEAPDAPFAGPVGDAWIAFAEETASLLVAMELDLRDGPSLAELGATARALAPGRPLVGVVRGALYPAFQVARRMQDPAEIDGVVLVADRAVAASGLPEAPTLVVAPAPAPEDGAPPHVRYARGASSPFLSEPELPEHVARFLALLSGRHPPADPPGEGG